MLLSVSLGLPSLAQEAPTQSTTLWQGLAKGMTPEEAVPIISAMQGIKGVKVRGKPEAADRLKINYQGERIPVANMSFELMPQFENGRLKQVVLMSDAQCGENAMATFATLSAALAAKYPERIVSPEGMRRSDVARANLRSTQTGEPEVLTYGFANSEVVVLLSFGLKEESRPPYPYGGGSTMAAVWRLANSMYESRLAVCNGTGNKRMGVGFQYMARTDFNAGLQQLMQEHQADQQEIADKL
jgi:hypothetical protein